MYVVDDDCTVRWMIQSLDPHIQSYCSSQPLYSPHKPNALVRAAGTVYRDTCHVCACIVSVYAVMKLSYKLGF